MIQRRIAGSVAAEAHWITPENLLADDGSYSSLSFVSDYYDAPIDFYNFNFDIPEGSTINGIFVEIKGYYTYASSMSSHTHNIDLMDGSNKTTLYNSTLPKNTASVQSIFTPEDSLPSYITRNKIMDNTASGFTVRFSPYMRYSGLIHYLDYLAVSIDYTPPANTRKTQTKFPTGYYTPSGYYPLNNPEKLLAADGDCNLEHLQTYSSDYADYYGFNFDIPEGSTINGVQVNTRLWFTNGLNGYSRYYLYASGSSKSTAEVGISTQNKLGAREYARSFSYLPSVAEINDSTLLTGLALRLMLHGANPGGSYSDDADSFIDYVSLSVDYTPPDNLAEFEPAEAVASVPPQVFNVQGGTFDALGRAAIAGYTEFGLPLMDYAYATPVAEYVPTNESEVTFDVAAATAAGSDFTTIVGIAPAVEPFALQLYATETELPITTLYEFENLTYSRSENEAGQVQITFPAGHPANKAIRDIYTAEPHGIYGILYRRGEPWAGVILAETDITTSPISWSFLTFEALLREHKTPWKWHGLEGLTIQQALTALCEKGLKWHQVASAEGLAAATLTDTEVKTWAQLAGEVESGAYNQPMIILGKTGTHYKESGTAVFAWDFGDQVPLERIRWRCSLGEYVSLAVQYRCSPDNVSWTGWTDEAAVADQDYAETYGIAAAGTYRYLEVKFTLRTEDTTTKDQAGNAVGTSPVLFGVEVLTSYDTGIDAYSIDVADEALKRGFDFSHENHLAAIASICEDYGYRFRVDEQRRLYVWEPSATAPIIVKKGETCEPTAVRYQGLSDIQNSLTCYGAGEGLGRLSALVEDATSILIYGRRPGIFEDSKITTLTALQAAATDELYNRAYPVLEAQIRAPYEPGRGVLDAKVHDYVLYIDPETFTGSDNLGQGLFEITAESREFTAAGEMVTLGLNSSLDDMFTREAKDGVRSRYKRGKAVGQVPFDVRAIAGFAAINILWHGIAPEYIVEYSSTGTDGWKALARTAERSYLHSQLASGATFYYRVRAVYNGTEITGPSLVVSATTTLIEPGDLDTTAPAVPTGLAASTGTTQSTAGGIVMLNTLTWNAVVASDLSFYELRRSLDEIAWITAAIIPAGETTFIDTAGLVEATLYYYQIRAVDKVGNRSDWSASASVTTVKDATAPTFAATAPVVTAGFKRLVPRWEGSSSADISHYILQRQTAPAEWDDVNNTWKVPTSYSLTNFISNGDFSGGTTGWAAVQSSIAAASNTLTNTATGATYYGISRTTFSALTIGRKYYAKARVRVLAEGACAVSANFQSAQAAQYFPSPAANTWYDISGVITAAGTHTNLDIYHYWGTAGNAAGKQMEIQYVIAVDLTAAFGAGNEPSKAQMDSMLAGAYPTTKWFDGTGTIDMSYFVGTWATITGAAIRALQYHDTDVDFDTCYRYKVAAVDTSGNTSAYTSESVWAVPSQIGTSDAAYRFITAEMYGEIRNVLPYMWHQDIDATHPVEVPFYIPSETTQIVSVKLSAYGERFRANSTGAAAGGSHSHTVVLPNHTHSVGYSITFGDGDLMTGSAGGHSHDVSGTAATDGSHNHYVQGSTSSDSGHSHSVNINSDMDGSHDHSVTGSTDTDGAHTHSQQYTAVNTTTGSGGGSTETSSNQDAHSHDITYGIYESTTPAGVNLYIDNGAGYGSAIPLASAPVSTTERYELAEELDITAHIAGTGWKRLKLTSTRLGSVEMQLICKVDITA